jgi:hypothetical protein
MHAWIFCTSQTNCSKSPSSRVDGGHGTGCGLLTKRGVADIGNVGEAPRRLL